jgi:S-(hydroxymethyl)glutathione dehydrogenase/alcohol dehydrogenase
MKAAICYENNKPVRVEEIDQDGPKRGEVRVRMVASGVCHSDLSVVTGVMPLRLPCILGHEGAGIVEEVGEGVTRLSEGDRVVLSWITPCGTCHFCRIGSVSLCDLAAQVNMTCLMPDGTSRAHKDGKDLHVFSAIGTMAEMAVVPENAAVKVPEDTPLQKAALVGCGVMTGAGAVFNTAKVAPGSRVAVFGTGGVGLNAIQGAAIAGAEQVIAVDLNPRKLEFAKTFGATHGIDSSKNDPVAVIKELTGGMGVDYAFEAIGRKEVIEQAYAACRKGGTCVVIGVAPYSESVTLNAFLLPILEKKLVGCWYGSANPHLDIPRLIALYRAGKLKLDELVTKTYKLDEVNEAFADMNSGVNARGVILY